MHDPRDREQNLNLAAIGDAVTGHEPLEEPTDSYRGPELAAFEPERQRGPRKNGAGKKPCGQVHDKRGQRR